MKNIFKAFITITPPNIQGEYNSIEGHEYVIEAKELSQIKKAIKDIIWQSVELDDLIGKNKVDILYTKKDVYQDKDEFTIDVKKVVFTTEPSKYIKWNNKIPHRFSVNREESEVVIKDIETKLEP